MCCENTGTGHRLPPRGHRRRIVGERRITHAADKPPAAAMVMVAYQ